MGKGVEPIGEHISQHPISVAQYIVMRQIFDFLVAEERRPILLATMSWWEKEGILFINEGRGMEKL